MLELTDAQEQWLTALEGGSYTQTTGALRDAEGFCCLGVACDVSGLGEWYRYTDKMAWRDEGGHIWNGVLPPEVGEHLGLFAAEEVPFHKSDLKNEFDVERVREMVGVLDVVCLSELNDGGWSFKEIAGIVRRNPEAFFGREKEPTS